MMKAVKGGGGLWVWGIPRNSVQLLAKRVAGFNQGKLEVTCAFCF